MRMQIAHGLEFVRGGIADACTLAARAPASVRLVAVSKKHPVECVMDALSLGQLEFGENYAQELADKAADACTSGAVWHHIGRVQSSNAKSLAQYADYVHGLETAKSAGALSRHAQTFGRNLRVMLAVNFGDEEQKSGVSVQDSTRLADAVRVLPALQLVGLMTLPPPDQGVARRHFDALYQLREQLGGAALLPELSMGMSHDMTLAIAAGATMVRVGTAIFGARAT